MEGPTPLIIRPDTERCVHGPPIQYVETHCPAGLQWHLDSKLEHPEETSAESLVFFMDGAGELWSISLCGYASNKSWCRCRVSQLVNPRPAAAVAQGLRTTRGASALRDFSVAHQLFAEQNCQRRPVVPGKGCLHKISSDSYHHGWLRQASFYLFARRGVFQVVGPWGCRLFAHKESLQLHDSGLRQLGETRRRPFQSRVLACQLVPNLENIQTRPAPLGIILLCLTQVWTGQTWLANCHWKPGQDQKGILSCFDNPISL